MYVQSTSSQKPWSIDVRAITFCSSMLCSAVQQSTTDKNDNILCQDSYLKNPTPAVTLTLTPSTPHLPPTPHERHDHLCGFHFVSSMHIKWHRPLTAPDALRLSSTLSVIALFVVPVRATQVISQQPNQQHSIALALRLHRTNPGAFTVAGSQCEMMMQ